MENISFSDKDSATTWLVNSGLTSFFAKVYTTAESIISLDESPAYAQNPSKGMLRYELIIALFKSSLRTIDPYEIPKSGGDRLLREYMVEAQDLFQAAENIHGFFEFLPVNGLQRWCVAGKFFLIIHNAAQREGGVDGITWKNTKQKLIRASNRTLENTLPIPGFSENLPVLVIASTWQEDAYKALVIGAPQVTESKYDSPWVWKQNLLHSENLLVPEESAMEAYTSSEAETNTSEEVKISMTINKDEVKRVKAQYNPSNLNK